MKNVNIAILGLGTVGSGVYQVVQTEHDNIMIKDDIDLKVAKVLSLQYACDIPDEIKAKDISEITEDDSISIVVETIGGIRIAKDFVLKCLKAGKTVCTSNKQMIAMFWPELEEAAKSSGAGLYFEASVGGGIPLLRTIDDSLHANTLDSVVAIINGTTNYILTKMSRDGLDYMDVLKEAQSLGYAELDPTADVEAYDAMYKISILSSKCFNTRLPIEKVYREGITKITKHDIDYANDFGYVIKLLAIAKKAGNNVELRVHPTMISKNHALANVLDSFNAVLLHGNAVGDVMLYGRGAGSLPTASAVLADVIYAAHQNEHRYSTFENVADKVDEKIVFQNNWTCPFYLRLELLDNPGVLSQVTEILGKNNISIHSVVQKNVSDNSASIVFLTYPSKELDMQNAIKEFEEINVVKEVSSLIRIEG